MPQKLLFRTISYLASVYMGEAEFLRTLKLLVAGSEVK
jgi:hypothetical protein